MEGVGGGRVPWRRAVLVRRAQTNVAVLYEGGGGEEGRGECSEPLVEEKGKQMTYSMIEVVSHDNLLMI
jgi:hypothetical protein